MVTLPELLKDLYDQTHPETSGRGDSGEATKSPTPSPNTKARCGTNSGYQTHRRLGVPVCDACRDAHAAYSRRWRARREEKQC